jgi:2-polyprenyl-3-methyl-5-hydroxy-6-metoxy-1,4-benzoquinol methylase
MSQPIHYSACPVCGSSSIHPALTANDHTVSSQAFQIAECSKCSLRFTQDVPAADDIGRYYQSENYISHTDTSEGLVNRLYQRVRKRTLRQKRKLVEVYTGKSNGSVLDIGSGVGAFTSEMAAHGWKATGLEPDDGARKVALESYGVRLEEPSALFSFPAETFDAITLWHVLEHVHELERYIETIKRLLRSDGRIFIAVPNYTSLDAKVYDRFWAAYDVPRHLYHFSPSAMQTLIKTAGMQVETLRPMWFDSFYVSLLSSRYKNGNTNWPGALWTALRSNMTALADRSRCSSIIYIVRK